MDVTEDFYQISLYFFGYITVTGNFKLAGPDLPVPVLVGTTVPECHLHFVILIRHHDGAFAKNRSGCYSQRQRRHAAVNHHK